MRIIGLVIVLTVVLYLNSAATPNTTKMAKATRLNTIPEIDGSLNDACWDNALLFNDFIQYFPVQRAIPTQATEVRIIYDNYAIYIGAMLYDTSPDSILHELGSRDDNDLNADFFSFRIDPYNTHQDGFIFTVYASGVQVDQKFSDPTYDAVWESAVSINEKGWSVEMKIPYYAFRFPKIENQEWGMQVVRSIRRNREFDQWIFTPPTEQNPLRLWGALSGLNNINPPVRLSFLPYLSVSEERSPFFKTDGTYDYSNTFSYSAGADVKYGINESFTIDMTLFPDFGQVQFDNKVKNLGYREVVYNENRSFFKESTELFNKNQLFYSRRIGKTPSGFYSVPYTLQQGEELVENPSKVKLLNAIKLSGRNKDGLAIGFFNAVTDRLEATVSDSLGVARKIITEPLTNYNIVVFDKQLKNNSSVYFINTNTIREKENNDANVSGAGYTFFNKKNTLATDGTFSLSQKFIKTPGTSEIYYNQIGYNYFLGLRKTGGNFNYGLGHEVMSNTFDRSDLGFQSVNNFGALNLYLNYNLYKPWRFIRESFNTTSVRYAYNYLNGHRTDFVYKLSCFATLLNYNSFFFGATTSPTSIFDYNETRVAGRFYRSSQFYYVYGGISTDYRKKAAFDLTVSMANFYRDNTNNLLAKPGFGFAPKVRYRFSNRLSVTYAYKFDYDPFNPGFVALDYIGDIVLGARKLITHENNFALKYVFNIKMSLAVNARHYWFRGEYQRFYRVLEDGYLESYDNYYTNHDFNYNAFNIDVVYAWQFAPGSFLNITYKNSIEQDDANTRSRFGENFDNTVHAPQTNNLSLRLIYFLDYNQLMKKKDVV